MSKPTEDFRRKLLNVQEMSPTLRSSYQKELDALLSPPLTRWAGLLGSVLLVLCLVTTVLIARADLIYHIRGLTLVAHASLAAGLLCASAFIFRDLRKRKHTQKSVYSIAMVLTWAAGTMTVIALLTGLRHPSDPKSLFGAFYVFVFYFACAVWALEARIGGAELAAKEQSLRIECRLADIAERMRQ